MATVYPVLPTFGLQRSDGNQSWNKIGTINGDATALTIGGTMTVTGAQTFTGAATFSSTIAANGNVTFADDILASFGGVARISWDTTDANANELLIQLPAGGAVDVPVIVIGQSIESVDLGLYNGVTEPRVAMFGVGAVTTGPVVEFRKARGTAAAPTVVTTGDDLGTLDFYAAVAAGEYVRSASIRADASGTIATTRGPGNLSFNVATDAAPSVLTERLLITGSGQVNLTPETDVTIANGTGLIIGATAQTAVGGVTSELQVKGTAPADSTVSIQAYSADAVAPRLYFAKSRGAIGAFNIITTGDNLGEILAFGADGVDFNSNSNASAAIIFDSMGTIAADRIPGRIALQTATDAAPSVLTTFATIDADQNMYVADNNGVVIGHTAQIPAGAVTSELQLHGTAPADSTALLAAWSADAVAPRLYFAKSRSATVGTFSIITTGDNLGEILAFGDDGVDFNSNSNASAAIIFDSMGTIAADRVPGRITFQTATDAAPSVLTTFATIDADQNMYIADTNGLVVGHTAQVAIQGITPETEIVGTAIADGSLALMHFAATADSGRLYFGKSRGAAGAFNIITTGDTLGQIVAFGADGVDFNSNAGAESASIRFVSSGTIAADRIPGSIQFWTATDAQPSVATQRWTIDNAGALVPTGAVTIGLAGTRITQSYHTNLTSTNAVTVDSSEMVKHDIAPYEGDALAIVNDIDVITFKHDSRLDPSERTKMGLRAESVHEPLAVAPVEHPDGGSYPGVNQYGLETLLTKAIQQLSAKITRLEAALGNA